MIKVPQHHNEIYSFCMGCHLVPDETSVTLIKTGSSRKLPHIPLEPQPFLPRLCQVFQTLAGLFPAEYNSALHFGPGSLSHLLTAY